MTKKPGTGDKKQTQAKQSQASRQEIDAGLARLENIAKNLPPVDAVALVREGWGGRMVSSQMK